LEHSYPTAVGGGDAGYLVAHRRLSDLPAGSGQHPDPAHRSTAAWARRLTPPLIRNAPPRPQAVLFAARPDAVGRNSPADRPALLARHSPARLALRAPAYTS